MGDQGNFDPCECLMNHENAMRRLLSFIRQSQSQCTDGDCLDTILGPQRPNDNSSNYIMMFLVCAFFIFMYLLRPRSSQSVSMNKPNNDQNGAPPAPLL